MKIFFLWIGVFFLSSCYSDSGNSRNNLNFSAQECSTNFSSSSLVHDVVKYGINDSTFLRITPFVDFDSGEENDVSFYLYQINYTGVQVGFLAEHYSISNRSIFIDKMNIKKLRFNSRQFNIDSSDINIIYSESEFYSFKKDSSYMLVKSLPMLMMKGYYFYQLVNIKDKEVIEFVRREF